jgi:hypothetical protein
VQIVGASAKWVDGLSAGVQVVLLDGTALVVQVLTSAGGGAEVSGRKNQEATDAH